MCYIVNFVNRKDWERVLWTEHSEVKRAWVPGCEAEIWPKYTFFLLQFLLAPVLCGGTKLQNKRKYDRNTILLPERPETSENLH